MLAVANQEDCTVGFHDPGTGDVLDRVDVPPQPHELCFDPVRRLLYVSHTYRSGWYGGNAGRRGIVSVLDPDRRAIVDVIELGPEHGPHDLLFDAARDLLYVSVVDLETCRLITTFAAGSGAHGLALVGAAT
jgi:DNA-binding beta-propeller fold protein YncE